MSSTSERVQCTIDKRPVQRLEQACRDKFVLYAVNISGFYTRLDVCLVQLRASSGLAKITPFKVTWLTRKDAQKISYQHRVTVVRLIVVSTLLVECTVKANEK